MEFALSTLKCHDSTLPKVASQSMHSGDTPQRTVPPHKRGSTQGIVFGYNGEPIEEG